MNQGRMKYWSKKIVEENYFLKSVIVFFGFGCVELCVFTLCSIGSERIYTSETYDLKNTI